MKPSKRKRHKIIIISQLIINKKMDKNTIKIFIIAGEASGDVLGGKLIFKIKEEIQNNPKFSGKKLEIFGVGGQNMSDQGLKSLFDMSELSLMGFVEILPHLPKLIKRINQTAKKIIDIKPDIVVTIDSPDFCFRVIKKLNKNPISKEIKKIHFVAPTVWAYREKRAQKIAKLFDLLLVILPFEPPYFEKYGLKTAFVGHPITENKVNVQNNFRQKFNIKNDEILICLTPGSRMGEIKRIFPEMIAAMNILSEKYQNLVIAIQTTKKTKIVIKEHLNQFQSKAILVDTQDKIELFSSANFAIAKSGTNTLEMAMYKLPMIVTYKVNFLTYCLVKMMIKIKFANLINLILNREIIPEMIQQNCSGPKLAEKLEYLIKNPTIQKNQIEEAQKVLKILGMDSEESPSSKAAKAILQKM